MTRHTKKWKEQQLHQLSKLAEQYPVIAIASLRNLPAPLSQLLRKQLQGKAVIKVCKARVVKKALQQSKADSSGLLQHANESIAIIFSNLNAFELFAFLKKNKVSMPAKAGMAAPADIIVPAGDTGLPPGPALSDLKQAGLKTAVKGPTISIAEDSVIAKKGATISRAVASALGKLDIKPIKVGLNIVACLEKGEVFTASVLDIDSEKVFEQFAGGHRNAFNLAMEICYCTNETIKLLLSKAFSNAKAVALEANIVTDATAAEILRKAALQAAALQEIVGEQPAATEAGNEKK